MFFPTIAGDLRAELRAYSYPPRILSIEEQDKMRTVCRVSFD